jgi:hypothetical protein
MKKIDAIERMAPVQRRRFLKLLGLTIAAPAVPLAVRYAAHEIAGGKAHADSVVDTEGTFFIELNLRDQWDHGHVFVAPSLATYTGLRQGQNGDQAAMFFTSDELTAYPERNVYLTADSAALAPHLDTIAMIDLCEPSLGAIHGHESANAIRSPGRDYAQRPGTGPMYENDPVSNFPQGCEAFYTSSPTPASLHNYHQKTLDPSLRNGIVFKGISRSIHTAYHYAAGLAGGELDRIRSKTQLFEAFPSVLSDVNVLPSAEEAEALTQIMERLDRRYLEGRGYQEQALANHRTNLVQAREVLYAREPRLVSLPLTPEEEAYWSENVPNQMCTRDDTESFECNSDSVKAQIWEQTAYAVKMLTSGMTRTVALEFDYMDLHGFRPEIAVRTQAQQLSYPLARMIEQLQAAGIYDRTVIAVYTTDGSRSPAANSYGNNGKNSLILAGGGIQGGYYGDISVAGDRGDGHDYAYHMPDVTTGQPTEGRTGLAGRLRSADVWRTVTKALCIPDAVAGGFPETADGRPLSFMLRS